MVKIFSGDDTDFKGDQRLALTFAAPDVDFDGCTAEVEFLGQKRTFAQVSNGGRLVFSFTADETRGMRCGVWPVIIRLRDSAGRVRTVNNTNRIKVTDDVNEAYADGEQELAVALTSGGVSLPEIPAELDAEPGDSVGDFKRKYNSLLELLRNLAALAVMFGAFATFAASVATAPLDDIPGTAQVVTNVSLDGVAMAANIPSVAGMVHGDDREADKAAFPQGLKFRAGDGDGGNLRLRVEDPGGTGISFWSDSTGTTLGYPFLRVNVSGIWHPPDIDCEEYILTEWGDFTRTHNVLETMPAYVAPGGTGRQNYRYPISAGAFLDYFWTLNELPTAVANRFADTRTMKAASNLVDHAGSFVRAEDIEERAAQLAATSAVPIFTYSAWATDWPDDDEAQPSQPVFTNGAWAIWVKDPMTTVGPYTAQGDESATNLTLNLLGYPTAFWRTATPVGDWNAYGLARMSDVTNEVPEYTTNDTWVCNNATGEAWRPEWTGSNWYMTVVAITLPPETKSYILKDGNSPEPGLGDFVYTRVAASNRNGLGLARLKDLPTNHVTKAELDAAIGTIPEGLTPQAVTNIIRTMSLGGIWDETLQVWWTPVMQNGSLTYQATTNVNLNAEN